MLKSYPTALLAATLALTSASAQTRTQPPTAKPAAHAFEVVSIRPSNSGNRGLSWATTPDGYRTTGQSIWQTIMIAYFPQGMSYWNNRIQGVIPSWIYDPYNIDARVDEADLPHWQKQGIRMDRVPMLREMLQSMLADRCKLTFHRVPGSIEGYALVVDKHGSRLKASKPNEPLPEVGIKLADGGILVGFGRGETPRWDFHSATMADFVDNINIMSMGHPIVDRTGLAGRYNFVFRCGELDADHPDRACNEPGEHDKLMLWDWASLGLHLIPTKVPVDTLVIDHIEKPSQN